jgi:hypothetical protein
LPIKGKITSEVASLPQPTMPFRKKTSAADEFNEVAERLGFRTGDGKSIKGFTCQCPGQPLFNRLQGLSVHHGRIHKRSELCNDYKLYALVEDARYLMRLLDRLLDRMRWCYDAWQVRDRGAL